MRSEVLHGIVSLRVQSVSITAAAHSEPVALNSEVRKVENNGFDTSSFTY